MYPTGQPNSAATSAAGRAILAGAALLLVVASGCSQRTADWPTRADLLGVVMAANEASSPAVRAEIVRLAARSGAEELTTLVDAALDDPSALVRISGLRAVLLREGDGAVDLALYERVVTGDEAARRTALDMVLRNGGAELQSGVVERSLRHGNVSYRHFAFRRVLVAGPSRATVSRDTLMRALDSEGPVVSGDVIGALDDRGVVGARHPVHVALSSDDADARQQALRVLAVVDSLDAWARLRWMRRFGSEAERLLAVLGLARLGQTDAFDEVAESLRSGDSELTHLALRALAGLPNDATLGALQAYADDTRADVREAALRSSVALNVEPGRLVRFIGDEELVVDLLAGETLGRAPLEPLQQAICPDLLLRTDPTPLLRFLWLLAARDGRIDVARSCQPQIQRLRAHANPSVRSLAAHLHFGISGVTPADLRAEPMSAEALYAILDASLNSDRADFRDAYRHYLDHELLLVRVISAIGLLDSTLR